jgi:hypothetical protein
MPTMIAPNIVRLLTEPQRDTDAESEFLDLLLSVPPQKLPALLAEIRRICSDHMH